VDQDAQRLFRVVEAHAVLCGDEVPAYRNFSRIIPTIDMTGLMQQVGS
jgi:hypothetical protein